MHSTTIQPMAQAFPELGDAAVGDRFATALDRAAMRQVDDGSAGIMLAGANPIVDFIKDLLIEETLDLVVRPIDESISHGPRALGHIHEDLLELQARAIETEADSRVLAERRTGDAGETLLLEGRTQAIVREASQLRDRAEALAGRAEDIRTRVETDLAGLIANAEGLVADAKANLDVARANADPAAIHYFERELRSAGGTLDHYRATALSVDAHAQRIEALARDVADRAAEIQVRSGGRIEG